jgi:Spy/CpxP family protein refolding chaperone
MNKKLAIFTLTLTAATTAVAQHSHNHHQHQQHGHSPYSGFQNREIKALSQQQIDDLKAGKGMSLALPAELNGYPGPAHALELAEKLKLTPDQNKRIERLFSSMSEEARKLGLDVIAAERALDSIFKNKTVNSEKLKEMTQKAAEAQARLRESHLRYHLLTIEVLTTQQVEQYNRLRGY